ncbi:MAG: S24/S26 family peptidase, partial [Candidatus Omnitrophica bacterium]|nr:S24/S26 family peptidase [Candidatus Omnitrophota bacterium]
MKIQLDKTLPLKVSGGFILMDKIGINSSHNLFLFKTSGFSMWPFLRGGQKIIIKKVLVRDLKVGDLILYRKDNQTICHRLIKKTREGQGQMLYVRGDNAFGFEPVAE